MRLYPITAVIMASVQEVIDRSLLHICEMRELISQLKSDGSIGTSKENALGLRLAKATTGFSANLAALLRLDSAVLWVDPLLPSECPPNPCKELLEMVRPDLADYSTILRQGPNLESLSSRLQDSIRAYGRLEQACDLRAESPALEVTNDLETRSDKHMKRYSKGFASLSEDEKRSVRDSLATAIANAEGKITEVIKDLESEFTSGSKTEDQRASVFERSMLENFDAWRSTSAGFRNTVQTSFMSAATEKESQDA